jgi:tetratricopeptide (TPR) repeat protein
LAHESQGRIAQEEAEKKARDVPGDLDLSTLGGTIIAHRFPSNFVWRHKVEKAIAECQNLIQTLPKEDLPAAYFELGDAFWARHALTKDIHDLDEAICVQQHAISLLPDDNPLLPAVLMTLGISFLAHFEFTIDMADLEESISAHDVILLLKTPTESTKGTVLHSMAMLYDIRFQHTNDVEDLEKSVSLKRKSINLVGSEDSNMLGSLAFTLGAMLESGRYQFTSADFDEMIALERRAIELASEDDPHLSCKHINLSNSLRTRFERTGRHLYIQEAMTAQQKAIHFLPCNAHTSQAETYEHVAASAFTRYGRTNDRLDLEDAISTNRKAIKDTPRDDANRVKLSCRLYNLAGQLKAFQRLTNEAKHLDEAISVSTEAAELLPTGHRYLPIIFVTLGELNVRKYEITQDISNMEQARQYFNRALQAKEDTTEPGVLAQLGSLMLVFYRAGNNPPDLAASILFYKSAIEMTPDDHPDMASHLVQLAEAHVLAYNATGFLEQADAAIAQLRTVTTSAAASPMQRLAAARSWCRISASLKLPDLLDAFQTAILLISLVAGLDQTLDKRHENLKGLSQLSLEAAAAAIDAGKLVMAVEWLESGRCIVWNQLNGLRQQSLDSLELVNLQLAKRFMSLSAELENASSRVSSSQQWIQADSEQRVSMQEEVTAHVKLAGDWEDLLHSIRKIPGFETLLRPPSLKNLLESLPEEGVVIIVNVFSTRCDALVLIPDLDDPLHIRLPLFSMEKAEELRVQLQSCIRSKNLRMRQHGLETNDNRGMSTYRGSNQSKGALENTLGELWSLVVRPIFDGLGFSVSCFYDILCRSRLLNGTSCFRPLSCISRLLFLPSQEFGGAQPAH